MRFREGRDGACNDESILLLTRLDLVARKTDVKAYCCKHCRDMLADCKSCAIARRPNRRHSMATVSF